jgi:hypothetical protein
MFHSISTLLIRNLQDVFGENDPERRRAAIDELYTEDVVFYDPSKGTRSIASQVLSRRLIPNFAISQLPSPRKLAMAGASHGYRAALVKRRNTRERISSSSGTAELPPSTSSSTSCPE